MVIITGKVHPRQNLCRNAPCLLFSLTATSYQSWSYWFSYSFEATKVGHTGLVIALKLH